MSQSDTPDSRSPENGPRGRSALRIAALLGARVGGNALTFLYTLVLLRIATPEAAGMVMGGLSAIMLLAFALTLNVEAAAIRFVVGYVRANEKAAVRGFMRINLGILLALGGLALAAGIGLRALGIALPDGPWSGVAVAVLIGAPLAAYSKILTAQAVALDSVLRGTLPTMLGLPVLLSALLPAWAWLGLPLTADRLIWVIVTAFAVTAAVQHLLVRGPRRRASAAAGADTTEWWAWVRGGLLLSPNTVLNNALKHLIVAAAGLTLAPAGIAQLTLALSVIGLLHFAMKSVDITYSPAISRSLQARDLTAVRGHLRRAALFKLAGTIMGAALLYLFGGRILALFGAGYSSAFVPMLVLVVLPASDALFGPSGLILNVSGGAAVVAWSACAGVAGIVTGTLTGGMIAGAPGAAVGCGLGYLGFKALQWMLVLRRQGIDTSLRAAFVRG
ncbi:MAG: hypothetical protein NXH82_15725 [Rhodobacteraceae bacterium]|nr:hypothetical protein [Paracoccaceae bacterium]